MNVRIALTGTTGLVMHNGRLADPEDGFATALRPLVAKKKRTPAENAEVAKMEFLGSLYHEADVGVYVPSDNIIRTFEEAGRITKQGKAAIQAISLTTNQVPLTHEGPKNPLELWERPEFRFRKVVRVGMTRLPRVRPIFRRWSLVFDADLIEEILSPSDFLRIVEGAGRAIGICDARKLGYGRFTAEVTAE